MAIRDPRPHAQAPDKVTALVDEFTQQPQWGFLGQARVNVLRLNLALDKLANESQPGKK